MLFPLFSKKSGVYVLEIIVTVLMIVIAVYLFIQIGSAAGPTAQLETLTDLGADFWPRIILALLIILLAVNLIQALKKKKASGEAVVEKIDVAGFFKSKLFIGMVMVVVMALILPRIGFLPSCLIFLIAYGLLLGDRNYVRLVIVSLVITVVIYCIFQGALDIFLPRGNGPFRDFALAMEKLLPF